MSWLPMLSTPCFPQVNKTKNVNGMIKRAYAEELNLNLFQICEMLVPNNYSD
jgi:hypothetical protein